MQAKNVSVSASGGAVGLLALRRLAARAQRAGVGAGATASTKKPALARLVIRAGAAAREEALVVARREVLQARVWESAVWAALAVGAAGVLVISLWL